jgi:hypothetical protein
MPTIDRIERRGWFTWAVFWSTNDYRGGGVILGSPRYILRRLAEWLLPRATPPEDHQP